MAELSRTVDLDGLAADLKRFEVVVEDYRTVLRYRMEDAVRAVEALREARREFDRVVAELDAFIKLLYREGE